MIFNPDATWVQRAAKAVLLIRILVGWVFLSEGIQKFLFLDSLGVGRFVKIGIPWPQVMAAIDTPDLPDSFSLGKVCAMSEVT
jgi:uncharacterized membrane protein YphA (DoxX/SURF4 family)